MDNTILNLKETAEYLRSSRAWIYKAFSSKGRKSILPQFFEIESRYFFRKRDIDNWLSENLNAPTHSDPKIK